MPVSLSLIRRDYYRLTVFGPYIFPHNVVLRGLGARAHWQALVHSSSKKMTMFYAQAVWKDMRKHIYQLEHTSIFGIKSSLSRA